jgi:hypothetical protein
MKKVLTVLMSVLICGAQLSACDSGINGQIEKCVQSAILAAGPTKDGTEKSAVEAQARFLCLKAASGKD